ncbi:hypothetical protein BpHYR1_000860 [Brachionus plicatilis]|uniref:Uncharacterized protein n=1 Tax=Brachionus plicatilis TaxID=10195 RepID=A0A3M7S307_BRAPC|nr:hypothetical protein BpHYR1_000860 [Brachionus plicatilis]
MISIQDNFVIAYIVKFYDLLTTVVLLKLFNPFVKLLHVVLHHLEFLHFYSLTRPKLLGQGLQERTRLIRTLSYLFFFAIVWNFAMLSSKFDILALSENKLVSGLLIIDFLIFPTICNAFPLRSFFTQSITVLKIILWVLATVSILYIHSPFLPLSFPYNLASPKYGNY